jgi:cytochrome bd-type quinol oxidase subunit 2
MSTVAGRSTEPQSATALASRAAVATVLAGAVNAALVAGATAAGVGEGFRAVSYPPVLFLTVVGVVGATLVYALLLRRSRAPRRTFVRVAAAVLVLSFLPDLALLALDPAATVGGVVVLMLMHVVVAAASVGVLTRGAGLR